MTDRSQNSFLNTNRKDKFLLVVTPPPVLLDYLKDKGLDEVQFNLFSAPVPKVSVPSITESYQGQSLKITSQSREPYDPISVSFTIDSGYKNYWFLLQWLNAMNNEKESGMDPHFNNYKLYDQIDKFNPNSSLTDVPTEIQSELVSNLKNGQPIYNDYKTDITAYGLDEYNNQIIKFIFTQAFVTSVEQIDYNYRDGTNLDSAFTFEFSQFQAELLNDC